MINKKKTRMVLAVPLLVLAILAQTTEAYARGDKGAREPVRNQAGSSHWGRGNDQQRGHIEERGRHDDRSQRQEVKTDKYNNTDIWIGLGALLVGLAVVSVAAAQETRYETVIIAGVPYYYSNGRYYQKDFYGRYVRVNTPIVVSRPQIAAQPVYSPSTYYYQPVM